MTAPITEAEWRRLRQESIGIVPELFDGEDLPDVLLPYQSETVAILERPDTAVLLVEKSRRIGLTWGLAAYAVLRAARARTEGGMDAMYISYSQEMTREFIDACAMWANAFAGAAAEVDETFFAEDGDKSIQAFRIRFASGFEILALSSAPRSLRGKQGLVIIDEAAFVDNLAELIKAALAFLIWGGQVVICSTHDGVDNPFNQAIQDHLAKPIDGYRHIRIDLDRALEEGLHQRIALVKGEEWTPESEAAWRQRIIDQYGDGADEELYCIPTMGSGAWMSGALIEARMTADAPVLRLELPGDYLHRPKAEQTDLMRDFMLDLELAVAGLPDEGLYAFGFDFARVADLTVGTLLRMDQKLNRVAELTFELRAVPGDEQKAITRCVLDAVADRLIGAAFDATGMGWTVAEDMGRRYGFKENEDSSGRIWSIKFSEDWYRYNMPPLKEAFEDASIAISKDVDHLSDLRLVKLIRGTPRVPEVRTAEQGKKGKKRHGDYAIALALAHFASRMKLVEYGYTPVRSSKPDDQSRRLKMRPDHSDDTPINRNPYRQPLGASLRGSI